MPSKKEIGFFDLPLPLQIFIVIFVAIAIIWVYWRNVISDWWSQWWLLVFLVMFIIAVSLIVIWYKLNQPNIEEIENMHKMKEEIEKERINNEKIEKSIIRKKLLTTKIEEIEGLSQEEKEYLLNKRVNEIYESKGVHTPPSSNLESGIISLVGSQEHKLEVAPPLSSNELNRCIEKANYQCSYPKCKVEDLLTVHHIIRRKEGIINGGTNKENNLIVLCRNHHGKADIGMYSRNFLKKFSVANMKNRY